MDLFEGKVFFGVFLGKPFEKIALTACRGSLFA